jgi:hypothetical protein
VLCQGLRALGGCNGHRIQHSSDAQSQLILPNHYMSIVERTDMLWASLRSSGFRHTLDPPEAGRVQGPEGDSVGAASTIDVSEWLRLRE